MNFEDQTIKSDAGKLDLTLVPTEIIRAISKVRSYGTSKYGDSENWKKVEKARYKKAAYRHFLEWIDDDDSVDDESGLPHIWHLACNIAFLIQMEKDEKQCANCIHKGELDYCYISASFDEFDNNKEICGGWENEKI